MKTLELNEDYQNDFDGKYGFVFDHTFLTNPITSFCGRFSESPEKYGFEIWHTGSGCTGHGQLFLLDGKEVLMLITDGNLNHVSNETIEATVGIFDPDMNECFDHWSISR
jgi:hypothetical protein